MSSSSNSRLRYLKDRCINAYWMLRNGKFKLFFSNIKLEMGYGLRVIQPLLNEVPVFREPQVPGSSYDNKCRVLPPSYRPTVSQRPIAEPLQVDPRLLARELHQALSKCALVEVDQS